jgi:hypothetical protein
MHTKPELVRRTTPTATAQDPDTAGPDARSHAPRWPRTTPSVTTSSTACQSDPAPRASAAPRPRPATRTAHRRLRVARARRALHALSAAVRAAVRAASCITLLGRARHRCRRRLTSGRRARDSEPSQTLARARLPAGGRICRPARFASMLEMHARRAQRIERRPRPRFSTVAPPALCHSPC